MMDLQDKRTHLPEQGSSPRGRLPGQNLINPDHSIIQNEESENVRIQLNACAYYETSAKLGTGVEDFFLKLVTHIYKRL